ncbi:uncharacterized protein TNCV_338221 [Trichonephila clavipes]|nr:uncharacterized protein TNCV_338221 [Trichonephila clavipes]
MPGFIQMTGTLPPLLDSLVGGGTPGRRCLRVHMDPMMLCPGKGLALPNLNVDDIARNTRFIILFLLNIDMCKKSLFAIHKALIVIGGEPKSVKRLRSGDLLIETSSALQTKSLLLTTSFLDSPLTISPHKSLNTSRGVISEPDLLSTPEAEILEGFSDKLVIQVRRITIKKESTIIPTKHLILTFNSPKLPSTIKAGYLNCKIRPYIPNPLRCFKDQSSGSPQFREGKSSMISLSSQDYSTIMTLITTLPEQAFNSVAYGKHTSLVIALIVVNGDGYRAMITNFFIPELNNHDVQELWFQQDGATCHTARATIDLLKDTFGDHLISRFGPVNWPPRSCDLTPLHYFFWGYVKSLVYADKPQTLDHL